MSKAKENPVVTNFKVGDKVRVKHGVRDTDYGPPLRGAVRRSALVRRRYRSFRPINPRRIVHQILVGTSERGPGN